MSIRIAGDGEVFVQGTGEPNGDDMSFVVFFVRRVDTNAFATVWHQQNVGDIYGAQLTTESTGDDLEVWADSGSINGEALSPVVTLADDEWFAAAVVYGSDGTATYYARSLESSGGGWDGEVAPGDLETGTDFNFLSLGERNGTENFNGAYAGLKIWNAQLTSAELLRETFRLSPLRGADLNNFYPMFPGSTERLRDLGPGGLNLQEGFGTTISDEEMPPVPWGGRVHIIQPPAAAEGVTLLDNWALVADAYADLGTADASFTVSSGDDRLLVAKVTATGGTVTAPTAFTYGGQAMTQVQGRTTTAGRDMHSSFWYLDEAGVAAATDDEFDATTSGSAQFRLQAATYQGVDQTTPITDSDGAESSGVGVTPDTPAIDSDDTGMIVASLSGNRGTDDGTPNTDATWNNMTEQLEELGTQVYSSVADQASTAATFDTDATIAGVASLLRSHFTVMSLAPVSSAAQVSATIAGTSAISAAAEVPKQASASIAGTSAINTTVEVTKQASASIAGTSAINTTVEVTKQASASVAGTSAINTTVEVEKQASATIAGTSAINATVSGSQQVSATIAGTSAINTTVELTKEILASIAGTSAINASVDDTFQVSATLAGASAINVTVEVEKQASASIAGTSAINTTVELGKETGATIAGVSGLAAIIQADPNEVEVLDAWALVADAFADLGTVDASFSVSAGENRLLVIKVTLTGSTVTAPTGFTYGGQSMTQVEPRTTTAGRDMHSSFWYLDEAGIVAATDDEFDATTSGTSQFRLQAGSYQGVDQTNPVTDSDGAESSGVGSTPDTPAINSDELGMIVASLSGNRGTDDGTPNTDATWNNMNEQLEELATQTYSSVADQASDATTFDTDATLSGVASLLRGHFTVMSLAPSTTVLSDSATIAGTSDIDTTVELAKQASVSIAGTSAIDAVFADTQSVSATIAGAGDIDVAAELIKPVSAELAGVSAIDGSIELAKQAGAAIAGTSEITVEADREGGDPVITISAGSGAMSVDEIADQFQDLGPSIEEMDEEDLGEVLPALAVMLAKTSF